MYYYAISCYGEVYILHDVRGDRVGVLVSPQIL